MLFFSHIVERNNFREPPIYNYIIKYNYKMHLEYCHVIA